MARKGKRIRSNGLRFPGYVHGRGAFLLLSLVLLSSFACFATTIRTKGDLRLWQTVSNRSAQLTWPWAAGANSATLTFSNRVTRSVSSIVVPRGSEAEAYGNCGQPVPQAGETLVDVTLVQTVGDKDVAHETATLAYVSGAGGGPITVRVPATHEWNRHLEPRVRAFDPAWWGEMGESGHDIVWPNYTGARIIVR